ncbi:MAG: hypothetical protein AB7P18_05595 [Candidatus Binatia bacterium]
MKSKVTLMVERDIWRAFRIEAYKRELSASGEVERFLIAKLAEWQKGEEKPATKTPRKK